MITLICTNCKETLEMDDAFAGGVCRCQHCGTIQTVPSRTKRTASPDGSRAGQDIGGSKTLYQRDSGSSGARSQAGLDDLAEAVVSSGLSRKALSAKAPVQTPSAAPAAQPKANKKLFLIIGGAVAAVLVLVIVLFLVLHGGKPKETVSDDSDDDTQQFAGPNFVGAPLAEPSVVYVLDRGNSTSTFFDALKAACYHSLELIGPDKKFAVVLTDNGEENVVFPKSGLVSATPDQIDGLRTATQDIVAEGNSHLRTALEVAVARKPSMIVVATGKWSLDDDDVTALREAAGKGIKIDAFALGDTPGSPAMKDAAASSGGVFKQLTDRTLRRFSDVK